MAEGSRGRLLGITPDQMNEDQKKVYEALTGGSGARPASNSSAEGGRTYEDGSLVGPFNAMLYSPKMGNAFQRLGGYLRFRNSLPDPIKEIVILAVGSEWKADFEFWAHARAAREVGISDEIIEAIREDRRPNFEDPHQALAYDAFREIWSTRRFSGATYQALKEAFGEQGVMDFICLAGYYVSICMVLNGFKIPVPPGQTPPFGGA